MYSSGLEHIIRELIASKREGAYWDFKVKPHENKANLLHDILCLANSLHGGNRYLILGINDPTKGAKIIGLAPGQADRKGQAEYISFVRNQSFAGGIRPELEMVTLLLDDKEVDVIIVFNTPYKPFWLTADYRDRDRMVKAQHIYTRVGDTNTPLDKSADVLHVEKMWRQRFGLDLQPMERMRQLLYKPSEWVKDLGNIPYAYHIDFPEYRIKFSRPEPSSETYSYFFLNKKSFIGTAAFKYNSTTLFELEYIYLDEMRLQLPLPDTKHVQLPGYESWYYYYNAETIGPFLTFLTDGQNIWESRGSSPPFLYFKNIEEQEEFNSFLIANVHLLEEAPFNQSAQYAAEAMQKDKNQSVIDPNDIGRIITVYNIWRSRL